MTWSRGVRYVLRAALFSAAGFLGWVFFGAAPATALDVSPRDDTSSTVASVSQTLEAPVRSVGSAAATAGALTGSDASSASSTVSTAVEATSAATDRAPSATARSAPAAAVRSAQQATKHVTSATVATTRVATSEAARTTVATTTAALTTATAVPDGIPAAAGRVTAMVPAQTVAGVTSAVAALPDLVTHAADGVTTTVPVLSLPGAQPQQPGPEALPPCAAPAASGGTAVDGQRLLAPLPRTGPSALWPAGAVAGWLAGADAVMLAAVGGAVGAALAAGAGALLSVAQSAFFGGSSGGSPLPLALLACLAGVTGASRRCVFLRSWEVPSPVFLRPGFSPD